MPILSQPNTFYRLNDAPLDRSSVFNNLLALQEYLEEGTAYVGQVLALRTGANEPTIYKINEDFTYSPIGGGTSFTGTYVTSATGQAKVPTATTLNAAITLHDVARTGSWNDLLHRPIIPSIEGLATETWVTNGFQYRAPTGGSNVDKILAVKNGGWVAIDVEEAGGGQEGVVGLTMYRGEIQGNGVTKDFNIQHNLGSKEVLVQCISDTIIPTPILFNYTADSTSVVTIRFDSTPAVGENYIVRCYYFSIS